MMSRTHLALGLLASILIIKHLQPEQWLLFGGVLTLASVLPDIDAPKSIVGKKLWPISSLINLLFGHRGLMHTVYPPIIALMAAVILGYSTIGMAFIIGYGLHLTADMVTIQGVMPLFPLSKARASGFIKTGGITEYAILVLAIIATLKTIL